MLNNSYSLLIILRCCLLILVCLCFKGVKNGKVGQKWVNLLLRVQVNQISGKSRENSWYFLLLSILGLIWFEFKTEIIINSRLFTNFQKLYFPWTQRCHNFNNFHKIFVCWILIRAEITVTGKKYLWWNSIHYFVIWFS